MLRVMNCFRDIDIHKGIGFLVISSIPIIVIID